MRLHSSKEDCKSELMLKGSREYIATGLSDQYS